MPSDFAERRFACDLYQLGSMLCFVFTTVSFNTLVADELHPQHIWPNWGGTFQEVLPYVRDAVGRALNELEKSVPTVIGRDVITLVSQLCEPDYRRRGHLKSQRNQPAKYALNRIVTDLDVLRRRAEIEVRRSA